MEKSKDSSQASEGEDVAWRAPVDVWVIYDHPKDYPTGYVLRKHEVHHNGVQVVTDDVYVCPEVEPLRQQLQGMGKVCLGREIVDDPCILESWL